MTENGLGEYSPGPFRKSKRPALCTSSEKNIQKTYGARKKTYIKARQGTASSEKKSLISAVPQGIRRTRHDKGGQAENTPIIILNFL